ncbi:hypothetical protein FDJ44_gp21 [Microbacterium phage Pikmin]|uniref:Minor tail protein n=3 Tax=Pikminvirus pikmin TaxID=2560596 RepID=A0A2P1CKD3_9CAUD|nr:hypothetical protein FDJ44_gp21 [Microbacterium phage Pikmin]AVJ51012.1 hypothetical protein PBI_PAJAZA_21 [Microbacterium phage Pajaza]AVJ51159.1 hypothetical protein PBI_PIKMIN_21 [Microbacterium phage Pikmin]AVJ51717.1 hypothetical protein PBI_CASEY_21 [Microbacterium phage Casey]
MPLETPPTPEYGPDTFTDLAELARILLANDEFVLSQSGGGGGGVEIVSEAISLATNYGNNSSYVSPTAVKVGTLASLEGGVLNCPTSFSASVYYQWGTLPEGYEPTDGKHRMAPGAIYAHDHIVPAQFRVNANGNLEFLSAEAIPQATYLIIPHMNWRVD